MTTLDIISIKDFKSTSTQNIITLNTSSNEIKTYFTNTETFDESFDPKEPTNKCCLSSMNLSCVIHNLYDSSKTLVHNLTARSHKYPFEDQIDYQHIYNAVLDKDGNSLSNQICSVVQTQDTLYALNSPSIYGHFYVGDEYGRWLASDNGYVSAIPMEIQTFLYKDLTTIISNDMSSTVKDVIHGIKYNTLFEIPGNNIQNYIAGSLLGTTMKTKTQYSSDYSMRHNRLDREYLLSHTRQYSGIHNCNNQIYLTYTDTDDYQRSDKVDHPDYDHDINHIFAGNPTTTTDVASPYRLPHIEYITNINRGADTSAHKTSLYSLDVQTDFLTGEKNMLSADNQQILHDNVKLELQTVIRELAQNIVPANTQLFKINIS